MIVFSYVWRCQDCNTQTPTVRVGVSSAGTLAAMWKCTGCKRHKVCHIPIEEVIANIPQHETLAGFTPGDKALLLEMHILTDGDATP